MDKDIKIGILGLTEGNGHPYSWSAMFNGYNKRYMDECPFPVIPSYLYSQPPHTFGIEGAKVTHICCSGGGRRAEAEHIAKASNIENVLDAPEQMLGKVDAVICATDIGSEHVERCRPFLQADIPMLIDKPLTDNIEDLKTFIEWRAAGKRFISCSSMRFQKELEPFYKNHYELGELMYICQPMPKKFETYGIHALEAVFPLLGCGFEYIQHTGTYQKPVLHIKHKGGCDINIAQGIGLSGAGMLLVGSKSSRYITGGDSYYSFKKMLDLFVNWLKTGEEPFSFNQTLELMRLVIGGIKSLKEDGRRVYLSEILPQY